MRRGRTRRQQQAFIHPVTCTQLLGSRRHRTLVIGRRDAGKAVGRARDIQLHAVGAIVQVAADKQVIGQYRGKTTGNPPGRLQNVVLATNQALRFGLAKQGRAVLQGQGHSAAVEGRLATGDDAVAAGRGQLYRIGGARIEIDIPSHIQGADGVARRDRTAAFRV